MGSRSEFLAVRKTMLEEDVTPDLLVVDGAEGGTGAAPLECADTVGLPLTEGLTTVHRALDVEDKAQRVRRFWAATVKSTLQIMAAMGVDDLSGLEPGMLLRRVGPDRVLSHADLYEPLEPGPLLKSSTVPDAWADNWRTAHPDRFTLR